LRVERLGLKVESLRCRVDGSWLRVEGVGLRVEVQGRVQGLGFEVYDDRGTSLIRNRPLP